MSRLEHCFARCRGEGRAALLMYLMGGDPDRGSSLSLLHALAAGGVDMIELGYPFSDPILDGPVIQHANRRASAAGFTLSATIDLAADFRKTNETTPIVLMGYSHPIAAMGVERFVAAAVAAGIDGLIVADLPLAMARRELLPTLAETPIRLIPLAAPMLESTDIIAPDAEALAALFTASPPAALPVALHPPCRRCAPRSIAAARSATFLSR